ncbi:MAG: nucleotide exchange factor GrpE [Planctomycetaceae bacterium]|nr:nucleotide exchange factor GrpE [Planctomycetaceae bacterium]
MHDHTDFPDDPTSELFADEESELEQVRKELEETKDRVLRARAELENYRARIHRQMEEERKYASLDLMRDLLPVWDNLGRALDAVEKTQSVETLTEGVRLVYDQLLQVFGKYDCVPLEPLHQPFDPYFQESIAQLPNADYPPNTVIGQTTVGFRLHDRVVRPAQVVLAAPPSPITANQ